MAGRIISEAWQEGRRETVPVGLKVLLSGPHSLLHQGALIQSGTSLLVLVEEWRKLTLTDRKQVERVSRQVE